MDAGKTCLCFLLMCASVYIILIDFNNLTCADLENSNISIICTDRLSAEVS